MAAKDEKSWVAAFVTDLRIGEEHIPLDRVIDRHRERLNALRAQGLTWPSIARTLQKAGARRKDGTLISADQLRAEVSRLNRRKKSANLHVPDSTRPAPEPLKAPPRRLSGANSTLTSISVQPQPAPASASGKAVSEDEMSRILKQLNRK